MNVLTHDFCSFDDTLTGILHNSPLHMNQFQNVETSTLVEMLAQQTQQLTSMLLSAVHAKGFADCKKMIEQLQTEINLRRTRSDNTSLTRPDVPSQTDTTI